MTNGQIAKLQELARCCCMSWYDSNWIEICLFNNRLVGGKYGEAELRRLWHQYQPQIRAMRKNRLNGIGD